MHTIDQDGMAEATRLTKTGRVREATALIKRLLTRGEPEPTDRTPPMTPPAPGIAAAPVEPSSRAEAAPDVPADAPPTTDRLLSRLRQHLPTAVPLTLPGGVAPAPAVGMTRHVSSGPHGERSYLLFVPPDVQVAPTDSGVPLVLMLHGGTQDGATFAAATGFNRVAAQRGVVVVYPDQLKAANPMRFWNWFAPGDQRRGGGEAALLAGLVEQIIHDPTLTGGRAIDRSRVFVAGFSAGAAMAAVLADQYPDVFAAAGVHSGLASGAAHDVGSAFAAMRQAPDSRPSAGAARAIVFHGDADGTVAVGNADAVLHQFCPHPTSWTVEHGQAGKAFTRRVLQRADGRSCENWTVHGGGHAWAGGVAGGSYADPQAPSASVEMLRFFLADPTDPTDPPA